MARNKHSVQCASLFPTYGFISGKNIEKPAQKTGAWNMAAAIPGILCNEANGLGVRGKSYI